MDKHEVNVWLLESHRRLKEKLKTTKDPKEKEVLKIIIKEGEYNLQKRIKNEKQ